MKAAAVLALALVFTPFALACEEHVRVKKAQPGAAGRASLADGVVREIDLEQGTLTLGHGRLANLRMAPMESMVFRTSASAPGTGLKVGDKVRFRATLVGQHPTVTHIQAAR